jgi:hypothetical protein
MTVPASVLKIATRFKTFNKEMNEIWESYNLVQFYSKHLSDLIKTDRIPTLSFDKLVHKPEIRTLSKGTTLGALNRLDRKTNARRALIESVASFEHFLNNLVTIVYVDFPAKLLSSDKNESNEREEKLINIVVNSGDKAEMIEKIVEEKTRSIFYGKPTDFFIKDKARINFGKYFESNHTAALKTYAEVTARRNIIAHNDGKVDRKYLREVESPSYSLGQKPLIDANYLKESLYNLKGLASCAATLVIRNVYKEKAQGKVLSVFNGFNKLSSP